MSGSSSSGPTSTTVTNSNIPDYLAPYASNMLNAAQGQIFNKDMTGFNQFQAYGGQYDSNGNLLNPQDAAKAAVAGPSPEQQTAYSAAQNMQLPTQYLNASYMAGNAGQYAMDTAPQAMQYGQQGAGYGTEGANVGVQGGGMYGAQGAGYGALGSNIGTQGGGMYGGMGAGYGSDAVGLARGAQNYGNLGAQQGLSYGQNATNPSAVQAYMNPYLQASLNPQIALLQQQQGIGHLNNLAAQTQAGAFGGSRADVQNALESQADQMAMSNLIGQGYNQAFNTANQNMQTAANLGMQGAQAGLAGTGAANQAYQTGIQGAGMGLQGVNAQLAGTAQGIQGAQTGLQGVGQQLAGTAQGMQGAQAGLAGVAGAQNAYNLGNTAAGNLANIGNQQLAGQQSIANMQNQFGAQQQANQQQIINQEMQNYANAQQYPYMQLGFMNSLLRGLPTQQTSTSIYQAPPSGISQLGGLGTAALGATAAYNAATKASGGSVKSMAIGGSAVPMNMMSDQQLNQVQQNPASSPMAKINAQGLEQLHSYMQGNPQAAQMMRGPAQPQRSGVAAIGTGNMTQMAGGGIIALAGGGNEDKDRYPTHEEAVAAFNAAYPTPKYNKQEERGPISQAAHDLMVQFHLLPDSTPGTISPEQQRASVYGASQIGHAAGGVARYAEGELVSGDAVFKNAQNIGDKEAAVDTAPKTGAGLPPPEAAKGIDLESTLAKMLQEQTSDKYSMMASNAPQAEEQKKSIQQAKDLMLPMAAMKFGLALMQSPGGKSGNRLQNLLSDIGSAGGTGLASISASQKDINDQQKDLQKGLLEAAKYDDLRHTQVTDKMMGAYNTAQMEKENIRRHNQIMDAQDKSLAQAKLLKEESLAQQERLAQQAAADRRANLAASLAGTQANKENALYSQVSQKFTNDVDKYFQVIKNSADKQFKDLDDAEAHQKAIEFAYAQTPKKSRDILGLTEPPQVNKEQPPAPAGEAKKAKGNTSLPAQPTADYTYDPKTGKLVKGS